MVNNADDEEYAEDEEDDQVTPNIIQQPITDKVVSVRSGPSRDRQR